MIKQRKVNEPTRHNSVIINICFESGDLKKMWKWGKWRIPLRSKVSVNRRKWIRTEGSDRVVSHQKVASFADFHRVCVQWNCDIDLLEWPSQKESASGFFLAADQFCFYLRRRWRSILLLPLSPPPPKGKKRRGIKDALVVFRFGLGWHWALCQEVDDLRPATLVSVAHTHARTFFPCAALRTFVGRKWFTNYLTKWLSWFC